MGKVYLNSEWIFLERERGIEWVKYYDGVRGWKKEVY